MRLGGNIKMAVLTTVLGVTALPAAHAEEVLHIYNWADYFAEQTLENFTKETGIKVVYDTYDSDEALQAKLLIGKSGYDVVFPGTAFAADMQKVGVFQKLDPAIVANREQIDTAVMKTIMPSDAEMAYFVPYTTAVTGFAYNTDKVKERLPNVTFEGWADVFNEANGKALNDCGIGVIDAPFDFFQIALRLNGKPIDTTNRDELEAAADTIGTLRPYIRYFNSGKIIEDLANGDICFAITWTGDGLIAGARAEEIGSNVKIEVVVPKEGSVFQANVTGIPADAPNPKAANLFINYLHRPDVHADIISWVYYGTANRGALAALPDELKASPGVQLSADQVAVMWPAKNPDQETTRVITRLWTSIKAGL